MTSTLCDFSNGTECSICGYKSSTPSLIRICTPSISEQDSTEVAVIACPTIADLYVLESTASETDFENFLPSAAHAMPTRDAPGFLTKVKNFAAAAAQHVAAGMPMASDEEILRRHDICLGCEHLQNGACTQCGCPISRVAGYVSKLSWANEQCPVGKWGKAPSGDLPAVPQ